MGTPKPEELQKVDYTLPEKEWMKVPPDFKPGTWCYPGKQSVLLVEVTSRCETFAFIF